MRNNSFLRTVDGSKMFHDNAESEDFGCVDSIGAVHCKWRVLFLWWNDWQQLGVPLNGRHCRRGTFSSSTTTWRVAGRPQHQGQQQQGLLPSAAAVPGGSRGWGQRSQRVGTKSCWMGPGTASEFLKSRVSCAPFESQKLLLNLLSFWIYHRSLQLKLSHLRQVWDGLGDVAEM